MVSEEVTNVKQILTKIEKCFVKSYKVEVSMLLLSLTSMRYNGKGNIREYIMEISHIVSKLNTPNIDLIKGVIRM